MGWDDNGLPTERRVQNYYGVRCDPSLPYDPDFEPPAEPGPRTPRRPDQPAELRRAVRAAHRRGREGLRGAVPPARPVGRLVATSTPPSTTAARAPQPAGVPAQPRPRRGLPGRGARRCGTSTSAPPSPRPSSRTASCPAPTTARLPPRRRRRRRPHRHHPARAARRAASRSSPTPTTSATSRCSAPRCARRCSASRCPVLAHPLADPDKGTGIAMICTFGDLTDVTWWRELRPADARPSSAATAASPADAPAWLTADAGRRAYARAGRQDRQAGPASAWSSCCARPASCSASRARSPTR